MTAHGVLLVIVVA